MMDRALKERIIGAVVLVIFVVLVVPIFLDGPANDEETVQQPVLLSGQSEQQTKTVVLDRDRTNPSPVPVNAGAADEQQAEPVAEQREETGSEEPAPDATPVEPEPETVAAETPAPAAASSTGMWAVQLGSFSNRDNAEGLADQLRKQGYAAFVSQVATANGTMHRVRVGPQKDRDGAEQMASRLAKVGHQGRVVPHP